MNSKKKNIESEFVCGSIVMNANPFTLGHFHLARIAATMVDYLYIFVVEEDKSVFPFQDRFELIKEGLKEIENVKIIPGGKFIISNITFPEYFDKDNLQETRINASLDIDIFGRYIAKRLGISVRFAGEEPDDAVTRQYNQFMCERLPLHGVKFIEILRIKKSGCTISAKKVRELLSLGRLDEVENFVPSVVSNYIRRNWDKFSEMLCTN